MKTAKKVAALEGEVGGDEDFMAARRPEDGAVVANAEDQTARICSRALPCSAHPKGLRGAYLVNEGEFAEGFGHGLSINGWGSGLAGVKPIEDSRVIAATVDCL